jgi:hypothetical protein
MATKNTYNEKMTKVQSVEELNMLKESLDKTYEKCLKSLEVKNFAKSVSGKNFGYIKEAFEGLSPELFKTKKGRGIINKYVNCIKESKELSKMHALYESFRKVSDITDVDSYVTEAVNIMGKISGNALEESSRKLGAILEEACVALGKKDIDVDSRATTLNEAVEFVATHKKTIKNLPRYTTAVNIIKESIKDRDAKPVEESKQAGINESETKIVADIEGASTKPECFEKYKKDCIEKLREGIKAFKSCGDEMSSDRLGVILEKVERKRFNEETVADDVLNFAKIKSCLK